MYAVLFSTAYYGLLHVSELTSGAHPVKVGDVQIGTNKQKILFILRTSKTHNKGCKPQRVKICSRKASLCGHKAEHKLFLSSINSICPYATLRTFMHLRPRYFSKYEPFFVFQDRTPVTPSQMHDNLKFLLKLAGFDSSLYNTHSFKLGRTMDLLLMGFSVETIKKIGRWKSNAVFTYLT